MTSCLRCSSTLARISRSSLEINLRAPLRPRCISARARCLSNARYARTYATVKPGSPKDPKKDSKQKKDVSPAKPSEAAPGTEHLYKSDSPMAAKNQPSTTPSSSSVLTPEDEEALNEIFSKLKKGLPVSQRDDFEKAVKAMRSKGLPDDLKPVIDAFRGKKSFDLATAAKVVRITSRLARQVAEEISKPENNEVEGGQKSGKHDPGPQEQGQQKQKKSGEGPKFNFGNAGPGGFREIKLDTTTILLSAFVSYMFYRAVVPGENSKDITWQEFRTSYLDRGLVQKLTVLNRNRVRVTLDKEAVRSHYPDSPAAHPNFSYYFSIGDVATFERHLDSAHEELGIPSSQRIPVSYDDETPWMGVLVSFAPTLLLIGATFYIFRRSAGGGGGGAGGIFSMGKSKAKKFNHETDIKIGFKDVAGMDEAKQEIMEFVSFLKEPGMYQKLGAKIPRGAILSGPPGTGKTLLAKATAGESQVPFFSVSGSEFVEMFVGVGASRVRDLFANARKNTPCIIFIDEIDAIGKSRGKNAMSGGNDEREATLNQILTEMDGFNTAEQVVVLAGTNRADVLDKALLRPGRFDRHISVDKPTMEGRKQIFAVHLRNIVTNEEPNHLQGRLAALTPGFSGADIANCVNEAALIGESSPFHFDTIC